MESILVSIKKLLGIQEEYDVFDPDLIIHINSVFSTLTQLNIGPKEGFYIEDDSATWEDYDTSSSVNFVKTYIFLKVKLLFDPPSSNAVLESMNRTISEIEFRLYVEGDNNDALEGGE